MQHDTVSTIELGQRVTLARPFGFFDRGDAGVIIDLGETLAEVVFDGGAMGLVPQSVLAVEVREFGYRTASEGISRALYPTEEAAAEAAEDAGHLCFSVFEVQHVAGYEVQHVPFIPPAELMA